LKRSHLILALCAACLTPVPVLADSFSYTGSVQTFTAPTAGEYDIVAFGASGGDESGKGQGGGLGAEMGGDFNLAAGEILDIYVGGTGGTGDSGGGGGGTFVVVDMTTAPLVIAGGGGGAGYAGSGGAGQTSVVNAGNGGAGDTTENNGGGGGGGFIAPDNGGNGPPGPGEPTGGSGFPTLTGGAGFGGGGYGGGGGSGKDDGGGGGGYGGGDAGVGGGGGGGGGSFLDPSVVNALEMAGENSGNGMVTVNQVMAPVPEPGTLSLLGLSVLAIAGLRKLGGRRTPRARGSIVSDNH
jgi:hypothetical protein